MSNVFVQAPSDIYQPKRTIALPCAELIKMVELELVSMHSCTYQIKEVLCVIVKSHEFGQVYQAAMAGLMPNTLNGLGLDDIRTLQNLLQKAFMYIGPILTEAILASGLDKETVRLSYFTHTPYAIILEVNEALPSSSAPVTTVNYTMEWSNL